MNKVLQILQLRFAGDLLMELGAGVELATAAVPHLFLPLACAANVAKVEIVFFNIFYANKVEVFSYSFLFFSTYVCVVECCCCYININSNTYL